MKRILAAALTAAIVSLAIAQEAAPSKKREARAAAIAAPVATRAAVAPVAAAPAAVGDKPSVADYSLVWRRNIFDPNRSPRIVRKTGPGYTGPVEPVDDRMRLAGVIVVPGNGSSAFISEGGGRGVRLVHIGEQIEGLTIEQIGTQQIIAREGDHQISWPVGKEILRTGKEPWRVPANMTADDIIERLRKRRLQEMKNEQ